MHDRSRIYVAGHRGLVGSALMKKLMNDGYRNIITAEYSDVDLTNQAKVIDFFKEEQPEYVFLVAAKVGGVAFLMEHQADVFYENTMIAANVIDAAYKFGVKKLLFIGGTSIYPCQAMQPIAEDSLLTGRLEPTLESYGLSKIVGVKMCEYYNKQFGTNNIPIAVTNLYGEDDNDDLKTGHVMPSLIRKFAEAVKNNSPTVEIWGTGNAYREFLHVDDLADACVWLVNNYNDGQLVNVGSGVDISIRELANLLKNISGFKGNLIFDTSKPDGVMKRVADCSKITRLGWTPKISLHDGIKDVYQKYYIRL